jgi:hypothetical protein
MGYELQVYALSPATPALREVMSQASDWVAVELAGVEPAGSEAGEWTRAEIQVAGGGEPPFSVEVSPALAAMKSELAADRDAGESVPDQLFEAERLYVLDLGEGEASEERTAAFVVTAWSLATLTEALVFDPQEELFADAESFWGLIMDGASEVS